MDKEYPKIVQDTSNERHGCSSSCKIMFIVKYVVVIGGVIHGYTNRNATTFPFLY